jgi:hydantoinase/carbamoylase family amidase
MPIEEERISHDIETIAGFNEAAPDIGYSRPTFSPAWRQARDYVIEQAKAAGCKVRIDAAGNVHARPESISWDQKVWLSGSHIDSVPTGGKFDGVIGVVCPLETLRATHAAGKVLPLELMIFAEEEGTTFGLGMIGSRLWVGELHPDSLLSLLNSHGQNYLASGAEMGVNRDQLLRFAAQRSTGVSPVLSDSRHGRDARATNDHYDHRFDANSYFGLIEIHIEQGPGMWLRNQPLAVVRAIAGRKQMTVRIQGQANHAGATSMSDRRDALATAAACMVRLEMYAVDLKSDAVLTVGKIECRPNAINVIPGDVEFTIDFRSGEIRLVEAACFDIRGLIEDVCRRRSLHCEILTSEQQPPRPMDQNLVQQSMMAGGNLPLVTSGALHDAAILAPHLPTAMLFVASKDGISHNPAEFSRIADIAAAARVLEKLVSNS